ncbi:P-loop NTPase fold protein [Actinomadura adrarensis]|uniref:P-loop NTPase fold protein n=1 Tax=Actinomadura adrarensis TaxID=1819600 RepID=A0ABW3CRU1_9ACTN
MVGLPAKPQAREVVLDGDLIPDNRLAPGAQDLLEHDAIARGVAEIAWTAEAPVNIALFGAWGSGKSSVYSMIKRHLDRIAPKQVKVARYDAWKYGGRELKRNFIDSLAHELKLGDKPEFSDGLDNEQVDTRLNTWGWAKANWQSLVFGAFLAICIATLWVLVQAIATVVFADGTFGETIKARVTQAGTVFGLALVAILVGPKVVEGAVVTKKTAAPEESDQFAKRFNDLVKAALRGKAKRLVVFIDELDRCSPKDVVATLIDLKTFLDQNNCVFIVAADREVIERALDDLPQAKPVREAEPYYATAGAFLDKIFQHQLALPPLRSRALTKFAHDLVDNQGGIWKELRDRDSHGQDTFDRTVFALIPVHVRSPRRVKVLLNNFATNARISGSRDIDWLDRAHELAVLTVLQTEFPAVAADLRHVPRLLMYIRGEETPSSPEVRKVLAKYVPAAGTEPGPEQRTDRETGGDPEAEPTDTAAARLLSDDKTAVGAHEREVASATLRRHLGSYLAKVAAAGIRDPRPDLLYLQTAGGRASLPDPHLGDVIDLATDTAPDTVVAAFDGQNSATLAVAIPLLVTEGDNETGPGQEFAYESACRLIERLDPDDQGPVTAQVAPSLMAAVTNRTLTQVALPGALLVACWDDSANVARSILDDLNQSDTPTAVLDSLTAALSHLKNNERLLLVEMLTRRFDEHPKPLLTALQQAPVDDATNLWENVNDRVLEVLNELEVPEPAPQTQPARSRPVGASAQTASTQPTEEEATGAGVERLKEIIETIQSRGDHEPLLSAILETVQSSAAVVPLKTWMDENADRLVGTMSSPIRHAWHALLGLKDYPNADVATWSPLLPDYDTVSSPGKNAGEERDQLAGEAAGATEPSSTGASTDQPVNESVENGGLESAVIATANELFVKLLGLFAITERSSLATLEALAVKVAGWASRTEQDVASILIQTLANIGWDGGDADGTGELLWERKHALFETVDSISAGDESPLYAPFVTDLEGMLNDIELSEFAITHWRGLCEKLPKSAAEELSNRIDSYAPPEQELGPAMGLRMAVRSVFGGDAPAAAELLEIPAEQRTLALNNSWLALSPKPEDVRTVLSKISFSPGALRSYCGRINTGQRTSIWLTLFKNGASDGILEAAGAAGLGPEAVSYIQTQVAVETREPTRSALVQRLRLATPAADHEAPVKRAASIFALDLLGRDTSGDLRTAAELILWAGGPGHGHKQALRDQFTNSATKHTKGLTKKTAQGLSNAGLLATQKKGLLSFLGR